MIHPQGVVLIVDDELHIRLACQQTLELAGFRAVPCESAEMALAHLDAPHLEAVVSDIRMPGMDGLTLMKRIHAIDSDLPVVLITGHGDVTMAVQAIRDGAYDFIEKPFPAELLADVVRRAAEKRRLVVENRALRSELAVLADQEAPIIGKSPAIERLRKIIAAVADTDADVLVHGETGTGKELVARSLHGQSCRRAHAFVALNCGAMPETIFESELFGHTAGAFTGALKRRIGRIEFASKGTLFLDEIESMPLALQVKLLRVLQERAVEPLGSNALVPVDIRVVAATKADLRRASTEKSFREDLYYRLNVVIVQIPPLRDRREDIPLLFQHFVLKACARYQREAPPVPGIKMNTLMSHDWPGNVRELQNEADRFVLGLDDDAPLATGIATNPAHRLTLGEQVDLFEKSVIEAELASQQGNVKATFEALGLPRKTFYDKLKRYGLSRGDFIS